MFLFFPCSIQNRLSDTEITESESCVQKESQLSPWEQWLIRKVKEDRDKLIKRKKEEELERQKKEQEETEKKEKCKKAEEKTKEWIEKKSIEVSICCCMFTSFVKSTEYIVFVSIDSLSKFVNIDLEIKRFGIGKS